MKTVDAKGQACPKPLIMTKKALSEISPGEQLSIIIDNVTSCENVIRFLTDNGMKPESTQQGDVFTITVQKKDQTLVQPDAASYCTAPPKSHIIVFSKNKMGQGSDELGEILVQALINIIDEVTPLPSHLVFYNGGIFLTCADSPLVETLKNLEKKGVTILVCGTCANHFGKMEEIAVGTVSNMYTILETMTEAGHIIQL